MIDDLPTGRRGQFLALAILGVVLGLGWIGIISPLRGFYDDRARHLAAQGAIADRMRVLAAELPDLRKADAGRPLHAAQAASRGESDGVAAARLQQSLQDLAKANGVSFSSVEIVPSSGTANDHDRMITIRLALASPWPQIVALLQAIEEEAAPAMLVNDLDLHGSPARAAVLPLQASFTISAIRAD